jgi:hypothetical protein
MQIIWSTTTLLQLNNIYFTDQNILTIYILCITVFNGQTIFINFHLLCYYIKAKLYIIFKGIKFPYCFSLFTFLISCWNFIHSISILIIIFTRPNYFCIDLAWVHKNVGAFCGVIPTLTNPVMKSVVQLKKLFFLPACLIIKL